MIYGIGTDIIHIPRIEKLINNYSIKFINRILGKNEITIYQNLTSIKQQANFIAKRFAGKESIAKAIGIGIAPPLSLHNIEILNNKLGKPIVHIHNADKILLNHLRLIEYKIDISLSDDYPLATAFTIISRH
ncbi:holo-[acyl-carrier-protein] synthase [Orientia chuto str. Dubai]|uniref:Holo-[acyl-carrier-protein] synthase n=1 Tax=Orientia chuto str. Dubai TaxID=1359168 RepID=A0A0F3MK14_9RICK|nr:holo-ACP synthase [Candidatus Orientia mediorientalis]KJV56001.1 holo-[acyl-carrier-protein] synthase [Orientia chuto str. Dubai]